MIRRLFYANLKLGTHQKFESKNSLYALAILYPFYNGTKLCQKKLSENFELDYTFLLEVSIKGNALSFTDDKAERCEINMHLGRIAATATAA